MDGVAVATAAALRRCAARTAAVAGALDMFGGSGSKLHWSPTVAVWGCWWRVVWMVRGAEREAAEEPNLRNFEYVKLESNKN